MRRTVKGCDWGSWATTGQNPRNRCACSNSCSTSTCFIGWFGPRGLASMVLGLIVVAEAPALAGRGLIEQVVALTALLSVLLYGVTAAPFPAAYARRIEKMVPDAPEKRGPGATPGATTQSGDVVCIGRTPSEVVANGEEHQKEEVMIADL